MSNLPLFSHPIDSLGVTLLISNGIKLILFLNYVLLIVSLVREIPESRTILKEASDIQSTHHSYKWRSFKFGVVCLFTQTWSIMQLFFFSLLHNIRGSPEFFRRYQTNPMDFIYGSNSENIIQM